MEVPRKFSAFKYAIYIFGFERNDGWDCIMFYCYGSFDRKI